LLKENKKQGSGRSRSRDRITVPQALEEAEQWDAERELETIRMEQMREELLGYEMSSDEQQPKSRGPVSFSIKKVAAPAKKKVVSPVKRLMV
jgi:hypothetical protein